WKHPEAMLSVAKRLKADGYDFSVRMIGQGELLEDYRKKVEEEGLQDAVTLTGAIPFEKVRQEMQSAQIFCFTSDGEEGWGAVLNESMNAGMAVVSSHAIGATPFLVKDGVNGLVYESGNVDNLYKKVKSLLDDETLAARLGAAAYRTIKEEWNGKVAAKKLLALIDDLRAGKDTPYEKGPCSKSPILQDNWYKA
ncbi:MAG: glycosyltransferase, partial [Clostridia bacterium]|nr:glycosyltransferase [Clostridia bacterium]